MQLSYRGYMEHLAPHCWVANTINKHCDYCRKRRNHKCSGIVMSSA